MWKWWHGACSTEVFIHRFRKPGCSSKGTLQPLRKALPSLTITSQLSDLNRSQMATYHLLAQATTSGAMIWASNWGTCMQTQLFIKSSLGNFFVFLWFQKQVGALVERNLLSSLTKTSWMEFSSKAIFPKPTLPRPLPPLPVSLRHTGTADTGGAHLGEDLVQPLQGPIQVQLDPTGGTGHCLSSAERGKRWETLKCPEGHM